MWLENAVWKLLERLKGMCVLRAGSALAALTPAATGGAPEHTTDSQQCRASLRAQQAPSSRSLRARALQCDRAGPCPPYFNSDSNAGQVKQPGCAGATPALAWGRAELPISRALALQGPRPRALYSAHFGSVTEQPNAGHLLRRRSALAYGCQQPAGPSTAFCSSTSCFPATGEAAV